ncbi:glycosyltransferase family 4 protein [Halosimplex sp. J119]
MSLRACYVVNAVDETSVPADIARTLVDHTDIEVDILAWFNANGFHGDDRIGVTCLDAPDTRLGIDLETARRARGIFREYDIVQAHHNHSGSFAKLIAAREGIPLVSREGNMRRGFTREGLVLNGLTNPLTDRVVCNSRAVWQSFRRWERWLLSDGQIEIIPNGVNLDRIDAATEGGLSLDEISNNESPVAPDDDAILVGTAGLMDEQKDQATLIRGVAAARSRSDSAIELVIAGDGPLEDDLRDLAVQHGIDDAVHFLGRIDRNEVYAMLAAVDMYAMPSLWEGFSAAAVEALASGTPAVFSDIPPFRLPYDDVALFHPPGDHETLAERLLELADDPDRRAELGAAGRSLVEREYTVEHVATRYRDLYRSITS